MQSALSFFPPSRQPRPRQVRALEFMEQSIKDGFKDIVLEMPTGCHAPDQLVIMADGTTKRADEVRSGDTLLGPDSTKRRVLRLFRGTAQMYRVTPAKGEPFIVNGSHVLALRTTPNKDYVPIDGKLGNWSRKTMGKPRFVSGVFTATVDEYLSMTKSKKHMCKLYYASPVEFVRTVADTPLDPWALGVWLGDGSKSLPSLSCSEKPIVAAWVKFGKTLGLKASPSYRDDGALHSIALTSGTSFGGQKKNPLTQVLKSIGVFENKHIPDSYKYAPAAIRAKVLAGLIDSDGGLGGNCYDYASVIKRLADDVVFLARSLGYRAKVRPRVTTCQTGATCLNYRVSIHGTGVAIPTVLKRKRLKTRVINKDARNTGFSVDAIGVGPYFGWETDGDHLYLLNDFLVTHNSGKSFVGATAAFYATALSQLSGANGGWLLVNQKLLQDQLQRDVPYMEHGDKTVGQVKNSGEYTCNIHGTCDVGLVKRCPNTRKDDCDCPYKKAKAKTVAATLGITNYAYFFTERSSDKSQMAKRRILICDEAHNLARLVTRFVDVSISRAVLDKWTPMLAMTTDPRDFKDIHQFNTWLQDVYVPELEERAKDFAAVADGDDKLLKEAFEFANHACKVARAADLIASNPSGWVFWVDSPTNGEPEAIARPLSAAPFAESMIRAAGDVRIYMSAYLGPKSVFCEELDLNPKTVAWLRLGSDFPPEKRPVRLLNVGSLARARQEATLPGALRVIAKLASTHKERGIIHPHSYAMAHQVYMALVSAGHGHRVLFPNKADEREEAMELHAKNEGSILISPSVGEGFDFKDDLARWQVIVKCPYASLGDKQVAAKMNANRDWYTSETLKAIVQMCGRIVRSADDTGITYVIDSDITKLIRENESWLPKWFMAAVR